MTAGRSEVDQLGLIGSVSRKRVKGILSPLGSSIYPHVVRGKDFIVETGQKGDRHVDFLLPPLLRIRKHQPGVQALILTRDPEDIRRTGKLLEDVLRAGKGAKQRMRVLRLGCEESIRREASLVSQGPDFVVASTERVIDHIRRENLDLHKVRLCVVDLPADGSASGFNADLEYIFTKFPRTPQTAVFTREHTDNVDDVAALLRRPASIARAAWEKNGRTRNSFGKERAVSIKSFDELRKDEVLQKRLKDIVKEIHDEEDPDELNAYKKIIKRNVPLFARAYFAAYLLKYAQRGENALKRGRGEKAPSKGGPEKGEKGPKGGGNGKPEKGEKGEKGGKQEANQKSRSDEGFQSIFVSVGKNRKVFPRDFVQLFTNVDSVENDDLGQIKILDNYSFVEVSENKAQTVIDSLNGTEFRGRKLTVNYARKKENG